MPQEPLIPDGGIEVSQVAIPGYPNFHLLDEYQAGNFVSGRTYAISYLGDTGTETNFMLIGASANEVGIKFKATGVGAGTGKAVEYVDNTLVDFPSTQPVAYTPCNGELGLRLGGQFLPLDPPYGRQVDYNTYAGIDQDAFPIMVINSAVDREIPFSEQVNCRVGTAFAAPYNWTASTADRRTIVFDTAPDAVVSPEEKEVPGYVPNPGLTMLSKTHLDSLEELTAGTFVIGNEYMITYLGQSDAEQIAGSFTVGVQYTITYLGDVGNLTDFTTIGASANTVGVLFTATGIGLGSGKARPTGDEKTAGAFATGTKYIISYLGDVGTETDFTAIGASSNTVGVHFIATGPGTGTGKATIDLLTDFTYIGAMSNTIGARFTATGVGFGAGKAKWLKLQYDDVKGVAYIWTYQAAESQFVFRKAPAPIAATDLVTDQIYEITKTGTTDFTLVGSDDSKVGTVFVATGAGTGTGKAKSLSLGHWEARTPDPALESTIKYSMALDIVQWAPGYAGATYGQCKLISADPDVIFYYSTDGSYPNLVWNPNKSQYWTVYIYASTIFKWRAVHAGVSTPATQFVIPFSGGVAPPAFDSAPPTIDYPVGGVDIATSSFVRYNVDGGSTRSTTVLFVQSLLGLVPPENFDVHFMADPPIDATWKTIETAGSWQIIKTNPSDIIRSRVLYNNTSEWSPWSSSTAGTCPSEASGGTVEFTVNGGAPYSKSVPKQPSGSPTPVLTALYRDAYYPHPELRDGAIRYASAASSYKVGTDYVGVPFIPDAKLTGLLRTCAYRYGLLLSDTTMAPTVWSQTGSQYLSGQPVRIKIGKGRAAWNNTSKALSLYCDTPMSSILYAYEPGDPSTPYTMSLDLNPGLTVPASMISPGIEYLITENGTTVFTDIGLEPLIVGASQLIEGQYYKIVTAGTTNFIALGADNNDPGTTFYSEEPPADPGDGTAELLDYTGRSFVATDVGVGTGEVRIKSVNVYWKAIRGCMDDSNVWTTRIQFDMETLEGPTNFETVYFSTLSRFQNSPMKIALDFQPRADWYVSPDGTGDGTTAATPAAAKDIIGISGDYGYPGRAAYDGPYSYGYSPFNWEVHNAIPARPKVDPIIGKARGPRWITPTWKFSSDPATDPSGTLVLVNAGDLPRATYTDQYGNINQPVGSVNIKTQAPNTLIPYYDSDDFSFIKYGWVAGMTAIISNYSGTSINNNGTYYVQSVSAKSMTLKQAALVTDLSSYGICNSGPDCKIMYSTDGGALTQLYEGLLSITEPTLLKFQISDRTKPINYSPVFSRILLIGDAQVRVKWVKSTKKLTFAMDWDSVAPIADTQIDFLYKGYTPPVPPSPKPVNRYINPIHVTETTAFVFKVMHTAMDMFDFSTVTANVTLPTINPATTANFDTLIPVKFFRVDGAAMRDHWKGSDIVWCSEGTYEAAANSTSYFYSTSKIIIRGGYNSEFTSRDVKKYKTIFKASKTTGINDITTLSCKAKQYFSGSETSNTTTENIADYNIRTDVGILDGLWLGIVFADVQYDYTTTGVAYSYSSSSYTRNYNTGAYTYSEHSVKSPSSSLAYASGVYNCHIKDTLAPDSKSVYLNCFSVSNWLSASTIDLDVSAKAGTPAPMRTYWNQDTWTGDSGTVIGSVSATNEATNSGKSSTVSVSVTASGTQIISSDCDIKIKVTAGSGVTGGTSIQTGSGPGWAPIYMSSGDGVGASGGSSSANISVSGIFINSKLSLTTITGGGGNGGAFSMTSTGMWGESSSSSGHGAGGTSSAAATIGGLLDGTVGVVTCTSGPGGTGGDYTYTNIYRGIPPESRSGPGNTKSGVANCGCGIGSLMNLTAELSGVPGKTNNGLNISPGGLTITYIQRSDPLMGWVYIPPYKPKITGHGGVLTWNQVWETSYSQTSATYGPMSYPIYFEPGAINYAESGLPTNTSITGNPIRVNGTQFNGNYGAGWFSGFKDGPGAPLKGYENPSGAGVKFGRYWE